MPCVHSLHVCPLCEAFVADLKRVTAPYSKKDPPALPQPATEAHGLDLTPGGVEATGLPSYGRAA